MNGLRAAVAFLTPVGGAVPPTPAALSWFPVVGTGIGALVGASWWGAGQLLPPLVVGVLVVALDLALTGMLHLDGLVDSADGLLPPLPPERRLAVMADPGAGAFGVAAAVVVLGARATVFASAVPAHVWRAALLVAGLWCLSRSTMALATTWLPYARAGTGGGLATGFLGGDPTRVRPVSVVGVVAALLLLVAWHPLQAPAVLVAALAGSWAVITLARRRIGGFTGDVLGAAGMVGETVGLVVAVAHW